MLIIANRLHIFYITIIHSLTISGKATYSQSSNFECNLMDQVSVKSWTMRFLTLSRRQLLPCRCNILKILKIILHIQIKAYLKLKVDIFYIFHMKCILVTQYHQSIWKLIIIELYKNYQHHFLWHLTLIISFQH